jgi:hypothetical protein
MYIEIEDEEWVQISAETEQGKQVEYSTQARWKNKEGGTGPISKIMFRITYRWGENGNGMDFEVGVEEPPVNGELKVTLSIEPMGISTGCCYEKMERSQKGHGFSFSDNEGRKLAEVNVEDEASILKDGNPGMIDTEVEIESIEESGVLSISSSLDEDITTFDVDGTFSFLETLIEVLDEAGQEAISYIMDHIVSFLLGTMLLVIVITLSAIFMSRRSVDTKGRELELDNNMFYRRN